MAWTAEDRRKYAPAIQEMVRSGMIARLARTMDAIDPQPRVGRRRLWSTIIMLQALWHLARDGCAWRRLPGTFPPHTTVWSRLHRWRELAVLDRPWPSSSPASASPGAASGGRRRRSSTPRAYGPGRSGAPAATTPARR